MTSPRRRVGYRRPLAGRSSCRLFDTRSTARRPFRSATRVHAHVQFGLARQICRRDRAGLRHSFEHLQPVAYVAECATQSRRVILGEPQTKRLFVTLPFTVCCGDALAANGFRTAAAAIRRKNPFLSVCTACLAFLPCQRRSELRAQSKIPPGYKTLYSGRVDAGSS